MSSQQHAKDLRSFLAEVKERYSEELITIDREADLRFEISALLVKLDRAHKFPITMFNNLRDVEGKPCAIFQRNDSLRRNFLVLPQHSEI